MQQPGLVKCSGRANHGLGTSSAKEIAGAPCALTRVLSISTEIDSDVTGRQLLYRIAPRSVVDPGLPCEKAEPGLQSRFLLRGFTRPLLKVNLVRKESDNRNHAHDHQERRSRCRGPEPPQFVQFVTGLQIE